MSDNSNEEEGFIEDLINENEEGNENIIVNNNGSSVESVRAPPPPSNSNEEEEAGEEEEYAVVPAAVPTPGSVAAAAAAAAAVAAAAAPGAPSPNVGAVAAGAGAAAAEEAGAEEEGGVDWSLIFQLGDFVRIDTPKYGGPVMGTIYYRSGELIRVMPVGAPNRLYDFQRDPDEEEFLPEEGVTESFILKKRTLNTFVEQQDLRVGQTLETLKGGELLPTKYTVKEVNEEEDAIVLEDETGTDVRLTFGGVGIPLDAPFDILRILAGPPEVVSLGAEAGVKEGAEAVVPVIPQPVDDDLELDEGVEGAGEAGEAGEAEEAGEAGEAGAAGAAGAAVAEAVAGAEDDPFADFEVVEVTTAVLPKVRVYQELKASERIIPDSIQKIDALNDFLLMFTPEKQRDPKILRSIRLLVESLYNLKQDIVDYNPDGTVKGVRRISAAMLRDLQEMTHVPLSRAVLEVQKRLYADSEDVADEEAVAGTAPATGSVGNNEIFFRDQMADIEQQLSKGTERMSRSVATVVGEVGKSIAFYTDEKADYRAFERPWIPGAAGTSSQPFTPLTDTEFFRCELPEIESGAGSLQGYLPTGDKKGKILPVVTDTLPFGVERALEQSYRKAEKRGVQILHEAESAPMTNYMLFPQSVARNIGAKRSTSIAIDSGRSRYDSVLPLLTMIEILQELGGIKEGPSPQDIVVVKTEGETLANIPVNEYLEGYSTPGTGIGDTFTSLVELGLDTIELRADTLELLTNRLQAYQAQLINTLNKLREGLAEQAASATAPVVHTLLGEEAWAALQERVESNAILKKDLAALGASSRTFLKSDIAKVVSLLRKHAELFQAVVGGQAAIVASEEHRALRDMYLETVEIGRLLRQKQEFRGAPPVPNKCEHVANLVAVRKLQDGPERMQALMKFLTRYQGKRGVDNNWIYCNICNKELLCVHERLQIHAFMNPKEHETIFKQLYINFSGGVFQGAYICKHCGQPIREISYDTHLQFDDEGRPMMGRAELVDKDAVRQEEIDMAMTVFHEATPELDFKTHDERTFYETLKEIATRVGLLFKAETYTQLVGYIGSYMSTQITRAAYDVQKFNLEKMARAGGKAVPKSLTFEALYAQTLVCLAGALVLVEAQTSLKNYETQTVLQGCVASFLGYPMTEDEKDVRGIDYLACAVASVGKNKYPWKETGYQKVAKMEDRRKAIADKILRIFKTFIGRDNPIKGAIDELYERKRRQIEEQFGAIEGLAPLPVDQVPANFLPVMTAPATKAAAAGAAEGALVPEAVRPDDPQALAQAWIQYGNLTARKSSNPILGSPYTEITCCKANITAPGAFWDSLGTALPALPPRTAGRAPQPTLLQTPFFPRPVEPFEAEVPADLTYRLFLKVCYTGDRVGLPHEPGLDNQCAWCGLQFPTHPSLMTDAEGRDAIGATPEIQTGPAEFQSLLNTVHTLHEVPPYPSPPVPRQDTTLERLKTLDPPPTLALADERLEASWPAFVDKLIGEVRGLRREGEANVPYALDEIAGLESLGRLSQLNEDLKRQILGSLQAALGLRSGNRRDLALLQGLQRALEEVAALPWANLCQVLETYMVVPFQQILTDYRPETLFIPVELAKILSDEHVKLLKTKVLEPNLAIPVMYRDTFRTLASLEATARLYRYVDQVRGIVRIRDKIRPMFVPGGQPIFKYLQEFLFYAPLSALLVGDLAQDSDYMEQAQLRLTQIGMSVGEEEAAGETGGTGGAGGAAGAGAGSKKPAPPMAIASADRTLAPLLRDTLGKFQKEKLNFDDEMIKRMIEDRVEREKQHIIGRKKNMSLDEQMVERRNMQLGLGRYAVGGTKKIYKYDAEQFDVEQEDWKAAGIEVFADKDPWSEGDVPEGDVLDENMTAEERIRDGAYDNRGNNVYDDDE